MCDDYASPLHQEEEGLIVDPFSTKLNLCVTQHMPESSVQISGAAILEGGPARRADDAKLKQGVG